MKQHKFGDSQYEAHINLGEMSPTLENMLQDILIELNFKTTDIVALPYKNLEQEEFYKIITTKDANLKNLTRRIKDTVKFLSGVGYKVQRYKIESTIFDSKYIDDLNLL